ncbi:hypothetical protein MN116_007528 [Schistosoma mekongi]|uniref:RRP4 S1 domain-containing protein n=1 Tax=Schistosoma mekongi TaxID=38744 RepID=A0AAE1Z7E6_SCHME|nr:hypothetical protein MN116_007528 [Schistosoma mekongi]
MPIYMYPAVAAPERHSVDYVSQGQPETSGIRQGSVVVPGEVVFSSVANLITGHGTYRSMAVSSENDSENVPLVYDSHSMPSVEREVGIQASNIHTSLTGRVRIVNKLVYVEPPKARYFGNVGDTIVGRIVEVEQRRWRVDVNSALLANLALANVKLPGGELRRKSEDDERAMRSFMKEGDLIVAEVHEVYKDGTLQLHMPGTRTGKLGGGCLLHVPPGLIKRQKIHRHRLAIPRIDTLDGSITSTCNNEVISVGLILGCNGYVWTGPARAMDIGLGLSAPVETDLNIANQTELLAERIAVCRVRNCILALTHNGMPVWETSVLTACEASWSADQQNNEDEEYQIEFETNINTNPSGNKVLNRIARLLHPEVARHLVTLVQAKLKSTY